MGYHLRAPDGATYKGYIMGKTKVMSFKVDDEFEGRIKVLMVETKLSKAALLRKCVGIGANVINKELGGIPVIKKDTCFHCNTFGKRMCSTHNKDEVSETP